MCDNIFAIKVNTIYMCYIYKYYSIIRKIVTFIQKREKILLFFSKNTIMKTIFEITVITTEKWDILNDRMSYFNNI